MQALAVIRRDKLATAGALVLLLYFVVAITVPWIAPYTPREIVKIDGRAAMLKPPSVRTLFGTDDMGRDIFTQVLYGTRPALIVGLVTAVSVTILGTWLGILAGYSRGWTEEIIMRIVDVTYGIPFLPLAMILVGLLGPRIWNIVLVLSLIMWRASARVVRAETLSIAVEDYIEAARAIGAGKGRILVVHVLRNVLPVAILYLPITAGWAVLTEANLSFLGYGDVKMQSWGRCLMSAFRTGAMRAAWWWALFPGLAIAILVLSIYFLSRAFERRTGSEDYM